MNFQQAVKSCFNNYAMFSGRAPRSEFWYWILFTFIAAMILNMVDAALFGAPNGVLSSLFTLAVLLPGLAVSVRRLHDIGRSGWWILIGFIPLVGFILLIIWYAKKGDAGDNQYGPDPLGAGFQVSLPQHTPPTHNPNTPASPPAQPSQSQEL